MASDEYYQLCLPILQDDSIDDDEKTERLEELLSKETGLRGAPLENTILSVLWRRRNGGEATDQPLRHTVIRKASPAPWQMNRAPTPVGSPPPAASSPAPSHGFMQSRPSFSRQKSAISSPFHSPKPSPRLALAHPIPHSPSLNAYEFSDASPARDDYGDYGSENVDWLLQDETASNASSTALSAVAAEWMPHPDMSPYDILRSVLGDKKTDDEIEAALNENSFDLGATIAALLGTEEAQVTAIPQNVLVGKSMVMPARPVTPNTSKSPIVCKYWLASGSCLRADCRFAHDTSGYLCKYFMQGQCLAGDACQFSHDPSLLINQLSLSSSPAPQQFQPNDFDQSFPSLAVTPPRSSLSPAANGFVPASQRSRGGGYLSTSRPQSRPSSRHQNRPETPSTLSMDDDSFPTLGSARRTTKHHGTRSRHGAAEKEPSSLADVVRMSPSPTPPTQPKKMEIAGARKIRTYGGNDSVAARRIPEPQHIPWLETGAKANAQYLKYRAEAIKHGSVRNKFLQRYVHSLFLLQVLTAPVLPKHGTAMTLVLQKRSPSAAKLRTKQCERRIARLRRRCTKSGTSTCRMVA
jgi:hypothetical protein